MNSPELQVGVVLNMARIPSLKFQEPTHSKIGKNPKL